MLAKECIGPISMGLGMMAYAYVMTLVFRVMFNF